MAIQTPVVTTSSSSFVTCHTCKQVIPLREGQPVCLLSSTGCFRDGIGVLRVSETVYECPTCFEAEFDALEPGERA